MCIFEPRETENGPVVWNDVVSPFFKTSRLKNVYVKKKKKSVREKVSKWPIFFGVFLSKVKKNYNC